MPEPQKVPTDHSLKSALSYLVVGEWRESRGASPSAPKAKWQHFSARQGKKEEEEAEKRGVKEAAGAPSGAAAVAMAAVVGVVMVITFGDGGYIW